MHQCKIEHDERFLVRPWGVKCACGFSGAALDKKEAEHIAKAHEGGVYELPAYKVFESRGP
jgi:hypothetical protein